MTSQLERAVRLLFPPQGPRTHNVKFLCGGEEDVTAEGLAELIVRAHVQIRSGSARLVENVDTGLTSAE